jgi:putative redox protein
MCGRRGIMRIEVETRTVDHQVTALGTADQFTLVVDRPVEGGGGGLGFNGGQLLYLAIAGCISNDLFREAQSSGIELSHVRVRVTGEFVGEPAVSNDIQYDVEIGGDAPEDCLRSLLAHVDAIAEIPNTLRQATHVRLSHIKVGEAQ